MSDHHDWTGHEAEMRAHEAHARDDALDLSMLEGYTTIELSRYAKMTDDQVRDEIRSFDVMFGQVRNVEEVLARIRRALTGGYDHSRTEMMTTAPLSRFGRFGAPLHIHVVEDHLDQPFPEGRDFLAPVDFETPKRRTFAGTEYHLLMANILGAPAGEPGSEEVGSLYWSASVYTNKHGRYDDLVAVDRGPRVLPIARYALYGRPHA